ncbi:MAG TPA: alpha/beta fold hydrolase [Woeseiaceae bacterium]|nr:alpha/beta fold hydrolase [Woeseiaceae bacterium]
MKSMLFSLFAVGAFVYVCFCLYLYLFQRSFIYFPTAVAEGVTAEEVWIDNEQERIRVWRLHTPGSDAIIYFGGNAEDVSYNVREFRDWFPQHAVYLVNYRGYGGSSGSPDEAAFHSDAQAVYDFVAGKHAAVSLIGRSLGAAVAVHLATRRDVDRLALVTPFDSLRSLASEFYPIFPTSLLLRDTYDAIGLAGRVSAPALVLVAEHDEIIPRQSSERLANALGGPHVIRFIECTGHNTIGASPDYGRALREFMNPQTGRATGR